MYQAKQFKHDPIESRKLLEVLKEERDMIIGVFKKEKEIGEDQKYTGYLDTTTVELKTG